MFVLLLLLLLLLLSSPLVFRRLSLPPVEICHLHSKLSRSQWLQRGRCSSHFTFLRLHVRQPARERVDGLLAGRVELLRLSEAWRDIPLYHCTGAVADGDLVMAPGHSTGASTMQPTYGNIGMVLPPHSGYSCSSPPPRNALHLPCKSSGVRGATRGGLQGTEGVPG